MPYELYYTSWSEYGYTVTELGFSLANVRLRLPDPDRS